MPPRPLKYFHEYKFKQRVDDRALCTSMWYLESKLKEKYNEFIGALEEGTKDHMEFPYWEISYAPVQFWKWCHSLAGISLQRICCVTHFHRAYSIFSVKPQVGREGSV